MNETIINGGNGLWTEDARAERCGLAGDDAPAEMDKPAGLDATSTADDSPGERVEAEVSGTSADRNDLDEGLTMKRTIKDSVFCDLFSEPRYAFDLYRSLHPEDTDATIDDVEIITIQSVLTDDFYNDLGLMVGDRLLVLVEAQSTWSENIALRSLLYAAQTIKDLAREGPCALPGQRRANTSARAIYGVHRSRA